VAYKGGETYTLAYRAVVERAPRASGVYTLYTPQRWIYVGEGDDIQQSLFRHLNEPDACMTRSGPLSFSFETTPPAERLARQQVLVDTLTPSCNPVKP
jgi:hypothetical protein